MTLPLEDLRVLAVEQYGAGPFGTMQLADLGAEVIKVEDPSVGGDVSRFIPPYAAEGSSLFFESFNRGKRSIALDLKSSSGRHVFGALVGAADAVVSNLRGDQAEKLRLRYEDLKVHNPRIVCLALSGFGSTGPRRRQGGYDYTIQGMAGWMSMTGGPREPPTKSGLPLVDLCSGYVLALALVAGVWQARREGVGMDGDLSLFETALAQLTYTGTWAASRGFEPERLADSAHQTVVPFQTFPTKDGWIVIAAPKQTLFEALCLAVGADDLATDERFATFEARAENRDELISLLGQALKTATTEKWLAVLIEAGVPCGAVANVGQALSDPQVSARGAIAEYEHPALGLVRSIASPLRIGNAPAPPSRGPFLGEHTDYALRELCAFDAREISELSSQGAFGPKPGQVGSVRRHDRGGSG